MIVYMATNQINGKVYIGATTQTLSVRKLQHISASKRGKRPIAKAIRKYGEENFAFREIETEPSIEKMYEREQYYIRLYDSMNIGYNRTTGGINCKTSEKTKKKMKETRLSSVNSFKKPNTKQISIIIDYRAWTKLLAIKKRTGNSLVSIIRIAIDEYIQRNTPTFKFADEENG